MSIDWNKLKENAKAKDVGIQMTVGETSPTVKRTSGGIDWTALENTAKAKDLSGGGEGSVSTQTVPAGVSAQVPQISTVPQAAEPEAEKQGFWDRLKNFFSGNVKQMGSSYGNAAATLYEAGQTAREQENQRLLQMYQRNLERAQRDLEAMLLDGGISENEIQSQRYVVEDAQRKVDAMQKVVGGKVQQKATQAAYETMDALGQSGAQDLENAKEGLGTVGRLAVDAASMGLNVAGDAALGAMTGGTATLPMMFRGFGSGAQQARQSGATLGEQLAYGAASAAVSGLTEKLGNVGVFKSAFGAGVLDKAIGRVAQKPAGKIVASALSEGGEEFLEAVAQPILQKLTYDPEAGYDAEWLGEALYGAAIGALLGSSGAAVSPSTYSKNSAPAALERIEAEQTGGQDGYGQNKTAPTNRGEAAEVVKVLADNIPVLQTKTPVATTSANVFREVQGNTMAEKARKLFEDIKGIVTRQGFGDVEINGRSVKDDLSHGVGPAKAATISVVPQVIQHGEQIDFQQNWKGRGYDGYTFAAPIVMDGETVYVAAVVKKTNKNRFYLHEVVDSKGNIIKIDDEESANPTSLATNGDAGTQSTSSAEGTAPFKTGGRKSDVPGGDAPSVLSLLRDVQAVKENSSTNTELEMPRLTRHDEELGDDGQPVTQSFKEPAVLLTEDGVKLNTEEPMPVMPGDADTEGYLDALAQEENLLSDDPLTPADSVYDAQLNRLEREEAPPETVREAVSKRDLDELVQLYQDVANPVDTARSARFEASEGLVSAGTPKERRTLREKAADSRSYFMRKMVDAGDSVTRISKTVKDQYLYPFYNMARSSVSAGINMIQMEQTDITGKRVGESLNDIFSPIRRQGEDYYNQFQTYLLDLHNIDRMSLVTGENTARIEAEEALRAFDRENPDVAQLTEARLQRKANSIDEEEATLAAERLRLLRKLNQADKMGNKPVFGYEMTADMSRERSDRLLREHPEFAEYRKQVRKYIDNLMQYRVDSGLMTQEDADFLQRYYPNYVPTFRQTQRVGMGKDKKLVRIGKTIGRAEGGEEKIVPLHEALGKQTMQVVREGSKNRFGARLLEDFQSHSGDGKVRKYILDAHEYESDFSTETFDQPSTDFVKENTFAVYKDGKRWEMVLDDSMFDAVKALSPNVQESNTVVKVIRAGNNLFKALVTGYNPTFAVRNTVRDLQTAGMYSRDGIAFTRNYPQALKEIKTDGEYWKQYKALGGSFSSVFDYQTGTVKEPDGKVAKLAAKMQAINMAMEQAPRLAEFMSVVKAGDGSMENLMDAMYAAADVTVNFGRAGTLGKVLNANFVPFMNPGIQGFDKMIRRVTETKGAKEWAKLVGRAAALGVAPTIINAMLYNDDEEWEDLRDSDKDTNYLFKIGDGLWLKIPKGRELSILGMTADRMTDIVNGEDVDWSDFIATVGNQVAPANPLRQNILAAWFDTDLFDASSPGKAWYGGDIESQRLQKYKPGERYDSSTDAFSKFIGKQLNLSPAKINYLLDQYSGVVGDFVLPLLTPQAERDMFSKAFTLDSVSSNEISGKFYDKSDELTYAKNSGDTTAQVMSRFWSKQQSDCSEIYAQIRSVEESDLPDLEKKERVREARAVLNGIQKNALETLEVFQKSVEKYLRGSSDEALEFAYREANRECFGAEYALEVYNKNTYAKAQEAHKNGVSYDEYYTYYFDTKDLDAVGDKSGDTRKIEYLQRATISDEAKAEIYFADLASDSDLKKQAELEASAGITAVQYWQYKAATRNMSKKAEKLDAIHALDLTVAQKDALYFANNWAKSTLDDEAPWYNIRPKLW